MNFAASFFFHLCRLHLHIFFCGGRRSQRVARHVVDDLGVDMIQAAVYVQAGAFRRSRNLIADALMTLLPFQILVCLSVHSALPLSLLAGGLAFLDLDNLACIADALAHVGLRLAYAANLGRQCPYKLLIEPFNAYLVCRR
jgi:hypothetical protein